MSPSKRFVYILKSCAHGPRFYTGVTADVQDRLERHNRGGCVHTAPYRPWQVHVVVEFPDEEPALKFERYLKSGSGRAFARRHFGEA